MLQQIPPVVVIETDFHTDVDDVGALAVAIGLHRRSEIVLAAVCVNTPSQWGPLAVERLREHSGLGFAIGRFHGPADSAVAELDYASPLSAGLGRRAHEPSDVLLRRVLAGQEAGSVTVVSIGFFGNLNALLASKGDDVSPLSGRELVRSRVSRTVVMGGIFPGGREFNVATYPAETQEFLRDWPTEIDFVGFETAADIFTGSRLNASLGEENPFAAAYRSFGCAETGRESWDPLTVLLAGRPASELVQWSEPGRLVLSDSGLNSWASDTVGKHRFAVRAAPPADIGNEIDHVMEAGARAANARTGDVSMNEEMS